MYINNTWLKGPAVSVANLATFLLDLETLGANSARCFHWKRVGNSGLGFSFRSLLRIQLRILLLFKSMT